jgi:hypothetical protein
MADYPRITVAWLAAYFRRWMTPGHGIVVAEGWQVQDDSCILIMDLDDTTYPQGPRRFEVWIREVPPINPTTVGVPPWVIPH